ncbi:response regulator [Streptomyces himalayensis]|uniref:Response regulator transcription factor n=2 Tax=Streptomyces himalayensis TaxID=2820085 RepID=A0A7W2D961_9ACTN|nr:response regulator transcription factor [Streptomyces himalayensis]MBA2944534.1 response regulator transcription factor [Streptomyces himalayensis subsp. himalayensis]MBA4867087.1 response regulator transcription factor [Streptomyces himalayensis subsp. aureolus]
MQTTDEARPGTDEPIRIIAVDDHSLLRSALCQLIDAEEDLRVVADVDTSEGLGDLVERTGAHVVLLDVEMPDHHAPSVVSELAERFPQLHVLMLTMYNDPALVTELLARGARGYLHKSIPRESLLSAIRNTTGRDPHVTIAVPRSGIPESGFAEPQQTLSPREREVLTHAAAALSNRQIATRLRITEGTVKRHLRNIFEKLGAVSRIDAVNKAVDAQLIRRP